MVGRSSTEGGWGVAYHLSFLDTCFHMWALTCVISHVCPYVRSHMCSHCVLSCVCSHQGVCVCVSTLIPVLSSMCVCACAHAFPCACSHRYIPICFFFCVCSLIPVLSIFVISHVCVCVTLCFQEFLHAGGRSQVGGLRPTKTPPTWVQTYLRSTVVQAVLLPRFCFHGGFHDTSPKPGFHARD